MLKVPSQVKIRQGVLYGCYVWLVSCDYNTGKAIVEVDDLTVVTTNISNLIELKGQKEK